jgi:hypothetical protein
MCAEFCDCHLRRSIRVSRVCVHYDVEEFLGAYHPVAGQIEAGDELVDFAPHLPKCVLYVDLLLFGQRLHLLGVEVAGLHFLAKVQQFHKILSLYHALAIRIQKFK